MEINDFIKREIEDHIDLKYLKFHSSLVPNINSIRGVRIPDLRKIAKTVSRRSDVFTYLDSPIFDSYEEITIYGLVIGYLKLDLQQSMLYLEKFISNIDNWATCDVVVSNLKFTKKHLDELYPFLLKYLKSKQEFEVRFAIIMFLDYYMVDNYIDKVLEVLVKVNHEGYYVKMALAWFYSVCYVKYKEKTMLFLKDTLSNPWIYQKTLQKILESNRVSPEEKEEIRKLKKVRL